MQELNGAWEKNPQRRRQDAQTDSPIDIDSPPHGISAQELELWHEIIENAPIRVLRNSDKFLVEMAARALAEVRYSQQLTPSQRNAARASAKSMLSLMGMTPADRTRVTSDPIRTAEDDALDEFAV